MKMLFLLFTIGVVAGCAGSSGPSLEIQDSYWSDLEEKIVQWELSTRREGGNVEQYVEVCSLLTKKDGKVGSVQLGLATAKAKSSKVDAGPPPDWMFDATCEVEKRGVFVMPPGVFVDNVRDAIPLWKESIGKAFVEIHVNESDNNAMQTKASVGRF